MECNKKSRRIASKLILRALQSKKKTAKTMLARSDEYFIRLSLLNPQEIVRLD
jgi:hypothetical protein